MNNNNISQVNHDYTPNQGIPIDYISNNPLEIELLHLNLITDNQYNFIKEFQNAFLRHKELKSTQSYEPKTNTKTTKARNKPIDPIAEIADDTLPYIHYINKYGIKTINLIVYYFCNNLTMKRLKELYTTKEIIKEVKEKRKKNGKIKVKEIERIKECFDEGRLWDGLNDMLRVMDIIEKREMREVGEMREREKNKENTVNEEEKIIKRLKEIVKIEGKYKICRKLGIGNKLIDKILNGYNEYKYSIYKKIKDIAK
jgi:hypothetical protein